RPSWPLFGSAKRSCRDDDLRRLPGDSAGQVCGKEREMIGQAFGRLTVVAGPVMIRAGTKGRRRTAWWATCSCGAVTRLVAALHLRNCHTESCGCKASENRRASVRK